MHRAHPLDVLDERATEPVAQIGIAGIAQRSFLFPGRHVIAQAQLKTGPRVGTMHRDHWDARGAFHALNRWDQREVLYFQALRSIRSTATPPRSPRFHPALTPRPWGPTPANFAT